MDIKTLGYNFPHQKGEFCLKRICDFYSVCCFSTPFLYLKDDELIKGNAGDILINPPGVYVYHGPRDDAEEGFINDWFQIVGDDFDELLKKFPLPLNTAFSIGKKDFLRKYAIKLSNEVNGNVTGRKELINCHITEMIIDIYRNYTKANNEDNKIDSIKAVHNEITLNPEKNWSLDEMAKLSGYSVSRFSELYKEYFGLSPINSVIYERIEMAKRLLLSGQASVLSVSEACGFSTVNYFSKCFKNITGCSPTAYRYSK